MPIGTEPGVEVTDETSFRTPDQLSSFPRPLRVAVCRTDTPGTRIEENAPGTVLYSIFQYTIEGHGIFQEGGTERWMPAGTGFLKQAGDRRTCSYYPDGVVEPWTFLVVEFAGCADMVRELQLRFGYLYEWPAQAGYLRKLMDYARIDAPTSEISNSEGCELIMGILRSLAASASTTPAETSSDALVERARREIQSHLDKTGTKIAETLGVTLDHLSRKWKKHTGESLHDYLVKQRVRRAALLLRHTTFTCTEIARQVGYRQEGYFAKVFKKHTGVTPSEFRKNPALKV